MALSRALSPIEKFFHQAALNEDPELLRKVLNSKDQEDHQKTSLHKASQSGNLKMVKALTVLGIENILSTEYLPRRYMDLT